MNLGYEKHTPKKDSLEIVKDKVKSMKFIMPRTMNDYYCNDLLDMVICIISEQQQKEKDDGN